MKWSYSFLIIGASLIAGTLLYAAYSASIMAGIFFTGVVCIGIALAVGVVKEIGL